MQFTIDVSFLVMVLGDLVKNICPILLVHDDVIFSMFGSMTHLESIFMYNLG